jgi:hypothetical protein
MQLGGGLGANLQITTGDAPTIYGQCWAGDTTGTSFTGQSGGNVYDTFKSGNDITVSGFAAAKDAYIAGTITGDMTVGGTLFQPSNKQNGAATAGMIVSQAVTVPPPCDCTNKLDVPAIVAWGMTNNNDQAVGLSPGIFTTASHPARIDLPCGEYYLTGFTLSADAAIVVHGHTVIFVDGSLTANSFLTITLADSNSSLDVFVSGTITGQAQFELGNANWPALTRLYLGTTGTFDLSSEITIAGNVWVGDGTVNWSSDADMYGSIFANNFTMSAPLRIHYDEAVVNQGSSCPAPTGCTSCKDCNNQACNGGTCGSCSTDADCCAPLTCQNGTCSVTIL